MKRVAVVVLCVALMGLTSGCSKEKEAPKPVELSSLFESGAPKLPGMLGEIALGVSREELEAKLGVELVLDTYSRIIRVAWSEARGFEPCRPTGCGLEEDIVELAFTFGIVPHAPLRAGVVSITVSVFNTEGSAGTLTALWGEPDHKDNDVLRWDVGALRVESERGIEQRHVRFTTHIPTASFCAQGKPSVASIPAPLGFDMPFDIAQPLDTLGMPNPFMNTQRKLFGDLELGDLIVEVIRPDYTGKRVIRPDAFSFKLPENRRNRDVLLKCWGQPSTPDGPWLNPSEGILARPLEPVPRSDLELLTFERYLPLENLVDDRGVLFFEGETSLLEMSPDAIEALEMVIAKHNNGEYTLPNIELLIHEHWRLPTTLAVERGAFTLSFYARDDTHRTALLDALRAKLGEPTSVEGEEDSVVFTTETRTLTATYHKSMQWELRVEARTETESAQP